MAVLQGTAEAATAEETDGQRGAQSGSLHGIFGYPFLVAVWGGGCYGSFPPLQKFHEINNDWHLLA